MVHPIKGSIEFHLHNPSLLPTPQCTFPMYGTYANSHPWCLDLSISKLGGWKHISAFQIVRDTPTADAQTHLTILAL